MIIWTTESDVNEVVGIIHHKGYSFTDQKILKRVFYIKNYILYLKKAMWMQILW